MVGSPVAVVRDRVGPWRGAIAGALASWGAIAFALALAPRALALPLSPGDRIRVTIPEEGFLEGEATVSGLYELDFDGRIIVPYVGGVSAGGLEVEELADLLRQELLNSRLFQADFLQLVVAPVSWGPVRVNVQGAVFRPGQIVANPVDPIANNPSVRGEMPRSGNAPPLREVAAALALAGGVRPEADLSQVRLVRNGREIPLDLTGFITGTGADRTPLIDGDTIVVPALASGIDPRLLRPSAITPEKVTVFFSNLAQPAAGGGLSFYEMEYGMRFSNAIVAARCVGGSRTANAKRRVAHIHTNRETGETQVMTVPIEDFLAAGPEGDDYANPVLMPGDGVVCYDSPTAETRDLITIIGEVLNPLDLIRRVFLEN
ncbi:MAG: polysaccharide biosynthesis/export family protein [Cyanobacteria bacterium]|nr:polysaccharide biosynthesis/export family protein [Cyanobacteriota bacterium]